MRDMETLNMAINEKSNLKLDETRPYGTISGNRAAFNNALYTQNGELFGADKRWVGTMGGQASEPVPNVAQAPVPEIKPVKAEKKKPGPALPPGLPEQE